MVYNISGRITLQNVLTTDLGVAMRNGYLQRYQQLMYLDLVVYILFKLLISFKLLIM